MEKNFKSNGLRLTLTLSLLTMMYHFNPSFFETATSLYNAAVVPECLRLLIKLFN